MDKLLVSKDVFQSLNTVNMDAFEHYIRRHSHGPDWLGRLAPLNKLSLYELCQALIVGYVLK